MPFTATTPLPFDRFTITILAPDEAGVYGIYNAVGPLYIGQAVNLRERLIEHLLDVNHDMHRFGPTHFVFEVCANRSERETELIAECGPHCNVQRPRTAGLLADLLRKRP